MRRDPDWYPLVIIALTAFMLGGLFAEAVAT